MSPDSGAVDCRIVNNSNTAVQYSWRQYATADEDDAAAASGMVTSASQSSPALGDVDADDAFEAQPAAGIRTCTSIALQTGLSYTICKQSARLHLPCCMSQTVWSAIAPLCACTKAAMMPDNSHSPSVLQQRVSQLV